MYKSIKNSFGLSQNINSQLKIMATDLPWACHNNEHALLYCSLDGSTKLCKVTLTNSEIATKITYRRTKGRF